MKNLDIGDLFRFAANGVAAQSAVDKITNGELLRDKATFSKSDFDGVTYEPKFDATRLRGEMAHVYHTMKDGQWRTLGEIRRQQYSEAGISARLRDLRKAKFGGHTVNRRRRGDPKRGLFEYQLL